MPIYRISKIYKKLVTTQSVMLLWDKKLKLLKKIHKTDKLYSKYLTKPDEFYILRLIDENY